MDLGGIESTLRAALEASSRRVVTAYLFGSVARGSAGPASDVDVAVLLEGPPTGRLDDLPFSLQGRLERALGREVQVAVLNTAPPDLIHRVLRDGRILMDRDPARRIRFEVRARNLYFDLQPFLARYRRMEAGNR